MYFLLSFSMIIAAVICKTNIAVSCCCIVASGLFAIADSVNNIGYKMKEIIKTLIEQYTDSRD